jgi:SAM-dependent methyltransferase
MMGAGRNIMLIAERARTPEIMDGADFTPAELSGNLADIWLYHRFTGGLATLLDAIEDLARDLPRNSPLSALDVGAGSADVAASVASRLKARGFIPRVIASDLHPGMLRAASRADGGAHGVSRCAADARALPHRDAAFDIAYSCLLLHHLDDDAVAGVLAEMRRVTRAGFVVLDLRRSALALASVWALTRLTTRNRLTLYDAPLSVRRALTIEETLSCARRGGLDGAPEIRGNGDGGRAERLWIRRDGIARQILIFRHHAPQGKA